MTNQLLTLRDKYLPVFILLLITMASQAQVKQNYPQYGGKWKRLQSDSAMKIPMVSVGIKDANAGLDSAQLMYDPADSSVKVYTGNQWIDAVRSSGGSPNSNIGSGYRLAVPGTNNVKTLFAGYGIIKDSTSNANGITTKLDTAIVFPAIRATIPGGSGSTELAHQGVVKNGDYIGLDSNGVNPLTRDVLIDAANRKITFENDRGSFVFDNASQPLVKLNGTGSAALFQADSGGVNKMRLMPRGQLALGDSVNLSIFIGHNSGLNYSPQGGVGNPPGRWNNALGTNALSSVTIGNDNIAIGTNAVRYLEDGTHNIGIGTATLNGCITCDDNIMIGVDAGANLTGTRNTGVGSYGQYLQNGTGNTSFGYGSQYGIVAETHTASYNTSIGYQSLSRTTVASSNTAAGYQSLFTLSTGGGFQGSNTAYGAGSGYTTNGDYNLFLGNSAGFFSNENNAFYLHTLTSGISDEATGKQYSMFYGKFANAGANQLRMNGKYGINTMPDSSFHVVGNSWLNGKLRITDGTQSNGYVLTSDANGNASWQASTSGFTNPMTTAGDLILATTGGTATRLGIGASGYVLTSNGTTASWQAASGGGTPAGNYGNIQLNRNSALATPGSDSLGYTTSAGFFVKNNAAIGDASNNVATLAIAAKDGEGKLAFKYSTTDFGYFKVNTASGQVAIGSDQYPVTINSGSQVTINNDLALNTTTLGLGRKLNFNYTGVNYGYMAIETNNSEFRTVSPNTYDFTWRGGSGELMRLKESNGSLGIGASPAASAKLTVTSTTQGFLPPRMTGTQAEAISSPAEGLMIYSTDGSGSTITSKGWWGYDGSTWVKLN